MLLLLAAGAALAQREDPNLAHPHELVTVERSGYTIAGLVAHRAGEKDFKYGLALFPGHPGTLRLRRESGELKFEQRGNFLVRTRRHWLDGETLVMLVDAPSDEWTLFHQDFRATARYGADIAALVREASRRYGVADWTFIGTSEGSISAYHAARMNPDLARRVILTSSLFSQGKNGPGLSRVKFAELKGDLLWVHHAEDPCRFTSYRDAQEFSRRTGKPLVTVRGGGPARGGDCEAFTAHGFVGAELAALRAMKVWIRTGQAPEEVSP
ncbi:MAG: alpha/beta fold hydrolase [Betaproteobacteria bacterium]